MAAVGKHPWLPHAVGTAVCPLWVWVLGALPSVTQQIWEVSIWRVSCFLRNNSVTIETFLNPCHIYTHPTSLGCHSTNPAAQLSPAVAQAGQSRDGHAETTLCKKSWLTSSDLGHLNKWQGEFYTSRSNREPWVQIPLPQRLKQLQVPPWCLHR